MSKVLPPAIFCVSLILSMAVASAADLTKKKPPTPIKSLPIAAEFFNVEGRTAFVMKPEKPLPGNPWVWYAPTLHSYPRASQKFYFEKLLDNGIAVAGCNLGEVRGSEKSCEQFTRFYDAMVKRSYQKKVTLLGQSRGGLMTLCWAVRNPEKVKAIVGIYPVYNLASWPLKHSRQAVLNDYQMTEQQVRADLDKLNPVGNLQGLAKNKVPIFIIHGDTDKVVPSKENSEPVVQAYRKLGGKAELVVVPGKGHAEIPEFFTNEKLLEFIYTVSRSPRVGQ